MHDFPRTRHLLSLLPSPREVLVRAHPVLKSQFRHLPFSLQQRILEPLMQEGFREAMQRGELDFLQGRWLKIDISDLHMHWQITRGVHGLILCKSEVEPDVVIRGTLRDFVALANQNEDPDTLFFQRRLSISGNTDLGLQVKNLMFSTEMTGLAGMLGRLLEELLRLSPSQLALR